jgi:catechol 2,3-dioxygenase-like lactoylglutathione lyase family enzyme
MIVQELAWISLTVGNLDTAEAFYTKALGFERVSPPADDPAMARFFGSRRLVTLRLRRGRQQLELAAFDPPGRPYPALSRSNDLWFQHCALVTNDMDRDYARLLEFSFEPISRHDPLTLPGGIVAYKFRDPDSHPLELIQFPHANPVTAGGIDHSAIAVSDAEQSVAFYEGLGLSMQARQVNTGPAQDALDGVDGTMVDVVALKPKAASPHLELLCYRAPRGRRNSPALPCDIQAARLVFAVDVIPDTFEATPLADGGRAALLEDPDGHCMILLMKVPAEKRRRFFARR